MKEMICTGAGLVGAAISGFIGGLDLALKALCITSTRMKAITDSTRPATPKPLPLFFPFEMPTNPTMAKTMPRMAKRKERLLMIGRIEVTSATIPNTREATAIAERGCVSIDDSLLLNALFLTDKEEGYPFSLTVSLAAS